MRHNYESYVGKRFGKLVVEKVCKVDSTVYFYCKCDCGTRKLIIARNMLRGLSRSCGCERVAVASKRRLPDDIIEQIIVLRASDMSFGKIALRLGVSKNAVVVYSKKNQEAIDRIKEESSWK